MSDQKTETAGNGCAGCLMVFVFFMFFASCTEGSSSVHTESSRPASSDPQLQKEGDIKVVDMQPDGRGGYYVTVDQVVRK